MAVVAGKTAASPAPNPIQHIVIIMQENRSFDQYFGTFPGADGIPAQTCVPLDPTKPNAGCVVPFHSQLDVNAGGPHKALNAQNDIDDGITRAREDGYILSQTNASSGKTCVSNPDLPTCTGDLLGAHMHDAVSYHTDAEIPNYWAYAENFVLQDHLFESVRSWSLPSHIALASLWSAVCTDDAQALSCTSSLDPQKPSSSTVYPWSPLFQLLDAHNVSWKYYLSQGQEPDCSDGEMDCAPPVQTGNVPSIWNPAPFFAYVKRQGPGYLATHVPDVSQFLADITAGSLPQVSWIVPNNTYSEHPPARITTGMDYVTSLVNAVMQSQYWHNTAIFITWDDWGGFYDHVPPPLADYNTTSTPVQGYGIRVPGLLVSAWARRGLIDHAVYSFDSYATFIENQFINGARLDPAALGNPDHRPDLRDAITQVRLLGGGTAPVGNLLDDFDFIQAPLPPLVLSTTIPTGITVACAQNPTTGTCKSQLVTLTWNSVVAAGSTSNYTYKVQRDGVTLPTCTGSSLTCGDTPGAGEHFYRVASIGRRGEVSPYSAAAEAILK